MSVPFVLKLTPEQLQELERVRETSPVPHVRTKAAALLKVAAGASIQEVSQHGLLKPVAWASVKSWITRYQQDGLAGWLVKAGRGRKPAFSPCGPRRRTGASRHRSRRSSQPAPL